ncbi:hypothetical protein Glove_164g67 [Diversispora epigaea]|uniref:Uncharacterized protein n=1 Tax=Diversispora epigaea TaxID=1348612 RepID=A0A397J0L1_9GLOM|nr:hypothetical protein Glove_164g67 [Diversispora epigaea]
MNNSDSIDARIGLPNKDIDILCSSRSTHKNSALGETIINSFCPLATQQNQIKDMIGKDLKRINKASTDRPTTTTATNKQIK